MKLAGRDALAFFRKPDPARAGILISGDDPMRVADRRQEVLAAMVGPDGEAEMRLTRMSGADLRRDGAALIDAVKAIGFFPDRAPCLSRMQATGLPMSLQGR